jgi:hypothetical protein
MMYRFLLIALTATAFVTTPLYAAGISGQYIEARTCDVWVAPCFANAEMNLAGKHAILGWKVERGTVDDVSLQDLCIVAVVQASDTLGLKQTGASKAILIVDAKANLAQREALIRLAKQQAGDLVKNVVDVQSAPIGLDTCLCKDQGCAELQVGSVARIQTRCLDRKHDKSCGNESNFYPPLAQGTQVRAAVAVENRFTGQGFKATWKEAERRGAYVGSFEQP